MKLAHAVLPVLLGAVLVAASSGVWAQSSRAGTSRTAPPMPDVSRRTLTPPRPAGLGGNLPPGHGGPNPSETRRASAARAEAVGLVAVCGPGGALSVQAAAGNPGRTRARALVCPG